MFDTEEAFEANEVSEHLGFVGTALKSLDLSGKSISEHAYLSVRSADVIQNDSDIHGGEYANWNILLSLAGNMDKGTKAYNSVAYGMPINSSGEGSFRASQDSLVTELNSFAGSLSVIEGDIPEGAIPDQMLKNMLAIIFTHTKKRDALMAEFNENGGLVDEGTFFDVFTYFALENTDHSDKGKGIPALRGSILKHFTESLNDMVQYVPKRGSYFANVASHS